MHDKSIHLNPLLLFIAAEWYKGDVMELINVAIVTGADPNISALQSQRPTRISK